MQCTQVWKHTNAGPHTCSCMAGTASIQAQVSARFKSILINYSKFTSALLKVKSTPPRAPARWTATPYLWIDWCVQPSQACLLLGVFGSLQLPSSDPPAIPVTEGASEWPGPDGTNRNQWCLISSVITKWGCTRPRRMARLWSMYPRAGLERSHITETCHSSLMSNLPHQKTFIPINEAFTRESCPRSVCVYVPNGGKCVFGSSTNCHYRVELLMSAWPFWNHAKFGVRK